VKFRGRSLEDNIDIGEPWYGLADRFTVRPWTGPMPVAAEKMWALMVAIFV
jgi:hypothetical protein